MSMRNVKEIIAAVRKAEGRLPDENLPCADPFKLSHIAVYKDDITGERVIPAFHLDHFTLNPIELNFKGEPYISKENLASPLSTKSIEIYDLQSIEKKVKLVIEL